MMSNIWRITLKDRYFCVVDRIDERHGRFVVTDTDTFELLAAHDVSLTYGANPSVDESDIQDWIDEATNLILVNK